MHFNFEAKSFSLDFFIYSIIYLFCRLLFSSFGVYSDLSLLYFVLFIDFSPKSSFFHFPVDLMNF